MKPQNNKMKKNILLIDESRCIGCLSCEAACKSEHDLPAELRPFRLIALGPMEYDGKLAMNFSASVCFHCDRPECVLACPTGAMQKNEDGIVFSDTELCIGCQTCAIACPFGIPELNPSAGRIAKCNGCMERVKLGLWPVCALKCPTGALSFGAPVQVVQKQRLKKALNVARSLKLET